jgi:hypothetical protein
MVGERTTGATRVPSRVMGASAVLAASAAAAASGAAPSTLVLSSTNP